MLEHGGRVGAASARWGIAAADWLDLSTGIAPWPYPLAPPPAECWQRLPEDDDGLEAVARKYYGAAALLPLPGSQAAIMALPRLRPAATVAVLAPGYGEHAAAWQAAGHATQAFAATELETVAASAADAVVLGNPNNPTGERFDRDRLLAVAARLRQRGGWLVVDEAFADVEGRDRLADTAGKAGTENLIVLCSLGKFFGLAGARVGFAIAAPPLLIRLGELIGPWAVANPARWAARQALVDTDWQATQRERLCAGSARLAELLRAHGCGAAPGTAMFRYVLTPRAAAMHAALARRDKKAAVRR